LDEYKLVENKKKLKKLVLSSIRTYYKCENLEKILEIVSKNELEYLKIQNQNDIIWKYNLKSLELLSYIFGTQNKSLKAIRLHISY
jgi:hypothetical protein